ncbi:hypothetical protein [Belnapia moabensis]|uniref:hypothetical protein n=1 Tax=Belnapia moabensis TaxID=365533 RepID=UPI0012EDD19A|nr:hypothetical protein [Belnapia moabensis]
MEKTKHDLASLVEEAAANMRQLMTAPPGLGTAGQQAQEAQRAALLLFEGVMATNKRFAEVLLNNAKPSPAVELQRRFVGEYFDALALGGTLVLRAAGEAAQQSPQRQMHERGQQQDGGEAAPAGRSEPAPTKRVQRSRSQASRKNGNLAREKAAE